MVNVPTGGTADVKFKGLQPGRGEVTFSAPALGIAGRLPVEVLDAPPPSIEAISPPYGTAGTRVTIAGANFIDPCGVTFGDAPAAVETRGVSSLVVLAPGGTGVVDVKVTCGSAIATKSRAFTYGLPRRRPAR